MNKTITITLGGRVFNVEEPAYPLLDSYLQSVRRHFGVFNYGAEVYDDIEARVAELFSKRLNETKVQSVSLADVESVIREMGTIEELAGSEQADSTEAKRSSGGRKLYRNPDDVMIAGVASGIAAYFGWDTTLVRILFVVTVLLGGWGIALYLVLWLVMPEAQTPAEKLEMRGGPVTVSEIEKAVKERVESVKNSGILRKISGVIGLVIRSVGFFIAAAAGSIVAIAASIAAVAATFAAAMFIFNRQSPYLDQTVMGVFNGAEYYAVIILAYVALLIPLVFLILVGVSVVRKKNSFNTGLALSLAGIWIAAAIGGGVLIADAAPRIENAVRTVEGAEETRNFDNLESYKHLEAHSNIKVTLIQGETRTVKLSGYARDVETADIRVEDNRLILERDFSGISNCWFCRHRDLVAVVTVPELESLKATGASQVSAERFVQAGPLAITLSGASRLLFNETGVPELRLEAQGASRVNLERLSAPRFTFRLSGASQATIDGTAETVDLTASGASQADLEDLIAQNADIEASGASNIKVSAAKTLKVEAQGASNVHYYGDPDLDIINKSNSSNINQR